MTRRWASDPDVGAFTQHRTHTRDRVPWGGHSLSKHSMPARKLVREATRPIRQVVGKDLQPVVNVAVAVAVAAVVGRERWSEVA